MNKSFKEWLWDLERDLLVTGLLIQVTFKVILSFTNSFRYSKFFCKEIAIFCLSWRFRLDEKVQFIKICPNYMLACAVYILANIPASVSNNRYFSWQRDPVTTWLSWLEKNIKSVSAFSFSNSAYVSILLTVKFRQKVMNWIRSVHWIACELWSMGWRQLC